MKASRLLGKILFPRPWVVVLFALLSAALLAAVFTNGRESSVLACVCYAFSFYSLCILCLFCWKRLPVFLEKGKEGLYSSRLTRRYMTDAAFRANVGLWRSLGLNLLYVALNGALALFYKTHWFAIFAVYYAILALMRFLLARYVSKNKIGASRLAELHRARLCAYILLTVNLALTAAVLMMVYLRRGYDYHGILIYVMALYTFYSTASAIIDMIRYRKYESPVMSMSKAVKMAAALVSMLLLETAMFSRFGGDMSPKGQQIMIMATGAGIAAVLSAVAINIIVRSGKEIRSIRNNGKQPGNI